jgi:hypothetical protein
LWSDSRLFRLSDETELDAELRSAAIDFCMRESVETRTGAKRDLIWRTAFGELVGSVSKMTVALPAASYEPMPFRFRRLTRTAETILVTSEAGEFAFLAIARPDPRRRRTSPGPR